MPKTVIVTGAASGFGLGASLALADRGHRVIATRETTEQTERLRIDAPALRLELEPQGIDVTLLNPGPYGTGFNDRMVDSMWEWFNDESLQAASKQMFSEMHAAALTDQLDPAEVVHKIVELTEADQTEQNNIVPADGVESLQESTGY
jgi:NAD(P)-dependent dehydrogenase (short-subunit alcohol dehydrogenase family)